MKAQKKYQAWERLLSVFVGFSLIFSVIVGANYQQELNSSILSLNAWSSNTELHSLPPTTIPFQNAEKPISSENILEKEKETEKDELNGLNFFLSDFSNKSPYRELTFKTRYQAVLRNCIFRKEPFWILNNVMII